MKKTILLLTALLLSASCVFAQDAEKKDDDKQQVSPADVWRRALPPESEQAADPLPAVAEESRDFVEAAEDTSQTEKRILDLERRLMTALRTRDAAALDHLLADDFIPVGVSIAEPNKANFIQWTLKNFELKSYTLEKNAVRAYPATAVVTYQYKRQASVAGAAADGDFTVTNVWIKRAGRWQIVSHHISQTPK